MPKRSSSDKDEVTSAFDVLQHVIATHDPEAVRADRVRDLERVCREVAVFARVAALPPRVIDALDAAATGAAIDTQSLLPVTLEDFPQESPAVSLGRAGGLKGGHARAKSLSKKRRAEIAKRAAVARWRKK